MDVNKVEHTTAGGIQVLAYRLQGGKQVVWADFQHLQERMGRSSRQVSGDQTQPLLGACAILSAAEGVERRESHLSTELSVALAWGLGLHHPWETRNQVILLHWFWEEATEVHVEERQDCRPREVNQGRNNSNKTPLLRWTKISGLGQLMHKG